MNIISKVFASNATRALIALLAMLAITGCHEESSNGLTGPQSSEPEVTTPPPTTGVEYDKQIRFEIGNSTTNWSTTSSEMRFPSATNRLIKFNKNNYPNVTRAVFAVWARTTSPTSACNVSLYNVTDQVGIDASLIQTTDTGPGYTLIESDNILDQLPDGEVDLSFGFFSDREGVEVNVNHAFVFLYRE